MSALSGIRVLDFTRVVSGPYCTQLLSDLGAEVVKIERPGSGDDSRAFGPPFIKGESVYFLSLNRGKKSVVIDLATEPGREAARRLAGESDVVIENFRTGYMAGVGLDYETLASDNQRLVYCSMTAFGETGPYKDRAGYDVMVSALGGMMGLTGMPDGPPVKTGVALLDVATGLHAATAICAGVRFPLAVNTELVLGPNDGKFDACPWHASLEQDASGGGAGNPPPTRAAYRSTRT